MKNLARIVRGAPAIAVSLLLASAAHADEIYKWVDKDGKTHYSSRKEDAGGAATTTMRANPAPAMGTGAAPMPQASNEEIIRRGPPDANEPKRSEPAAPQKPVARNYRSETNAAKCQLARDILGGRAQHGSGAPVDAYDRQIAENDVRTFCK